MGLAKNIANSVFWRGIFLAGMFAVNLAVTRTLGASASGWLFYLVNYFSFVILITGFCLESGFVYIASKFPEQGTKGLGLFAVCWTLPASLLAAALVVLVSPSAEWYSTPQLLQVCLLYTPGILLTSFFYALFTVRQNYRLPNLVLSCINLVSIAAILLVAKYLPHSNLVSWIFFASFLLQGVALVVAWMAAETPRSFFMLPSRVFLKPIFVYGAQALAANLIFSLVYRVDYFFVKSTCTVCATGDLGNYIQVSKLGQILLFLPGFAATSLFPYTAANESLSAANSLVKVVRLVLLMVLLPVALLAIIGHWLFPFLYGDTFGSMYLPFLLLIPGILSLSVVTLLAAYNAGTNRVAENIKGALLGLVFIVAGDWLLIPRFGIAAASTVSSVSYFIYMLYLLTGFSKHTGIKMTQFIQPGLPDWTSIMQTISAIRK